MILIMTLSSLQVVAANSSDATYNATNCAMSSTQSFDSNTAGNYEKDSVNYCQGLAVCAVHYSCVPLQSSSLLQVTTQMLVHLAASLENVAVSTRYPSRLERPPKV